MLRAIIGATFYTGTKYIRDQVLILENDKVLGFFNSLGGFPGIDILEYKNKLCLPGFIDLQINGGAGVYFTQDFSQSAIQSVAKTYRKYGTTSFLPTLVSTKLEKIYTAIDATRIAMKNPFSGVLGLHVEGPYLNPIKRGAHLTKYLRKPEKKELESLIEKGKDAIALLTIAPELFDDDLLALLRDSGIRLSAGHSNASYQEAKYFHEKGISKVTHLFNAMSGFQSREPGLVGAFFDDPNLYAAIIADGKHVDFAALRIAQRLKRGKLFFVTDAVFVDFKGGHFKYDGFNIRLENGAYINDENNLAGAAITMQNAIYNSIRFANISEADAFQMASSIPAAYLGLSDQIGNIKKGAFADLVIMDKNYQIEEVIFRGKLEKDM